MVLEVKADLDERVYSIYRLDCNEISLLEEDVQTKIRITTPSITLADTDQGLRLLEK